MQTTLGLTIFAIQLLSLACGGYSATLPTVLSQIGNPIYISGKPGFLKGKLPSSEALSSFTFSGWYRYNTIPTNIAVNVLTICNPDMFKNLSWERLNPEFPECPVSLNFLRKNPQFYDDFYIRNNPNCLANKEGGPTSQVQPPSHENREVVLKFAMENRKDKIMLQIYSPKNINTATGEIELLEQELEGLKLATNNWIFVASTFDYLTGKAKFFFKIFASVSRAFTTDLEMNLLNFKLKEDFLILYSENRSDPTNTVYGYLFDFNLYNFFIADLALTSLFNVYSSHSEARYLHSEILFYPDGSKKTFIGFEEAPTQISFLGQTENTIKGVKFSPGSFTVIEGLSNLKFQNLLRAPTFLFQLETQFENFEEMTVMSGSSENKKAHITVKIVRTNPEKLTGYGIKVLLSNGQRVVEYIAPDLFAAGILPLFTVSVVNSPNNVANVLVYTGDNKYLLSEDFNDLKIDFDQMKLTLSDIGSINTSLTIHRLAILDSPLGAILALGRMADHQADDCVFPMIERDSKSKGCIACTNSALLIPDHKCVNFCPAGFKNVLNTCVPCLVKGCAEIEITTLSIHRVNNSEFTLVFTKAIPTISVKNMHEIFHITLGNLVPKDDFSYTLEMKGQRTFYLKLTLEKPVYDIDLTVKVQNLSGETLYDSSRNFVSSLTSTYHIPVIRNIHSGSATSANAFAIAIVALYYACLAIGVILLLGSFKYNLNDYSCKKIGLNLQLLQLIPMWLYFNIPLPGNVHLFLSVIYNYTVGMSAKIFRVSRKEYAISNIESLPNFYEKDFTWLFLENFGFYIIIHLIIVAVYLSLMLANCFYKCYSIRLKEKVLKLREVFEYNFLIISFVTFDHKTFVFSLLNLLNFKSTSALSRFSLLMSVFYLLIYIIGFAVFCMLYVNKDYFTNPSDFKYKISYMLVGYKNRRFANFYEIMRILLHCFLGIVIITANSSPIAQIILYLTLLLIFFGLTATHSPHERKRNLRMELFTQVCFIAALLLLMSVGFLDYSHNYDAMNRETIGLVIMILLVIIILSNLIHDLIVLFFFVWKTRCSSKLVFVDRDENSSHFNKMESEDDLDNEIFFTYKGEANVVIEKRRTFGNLGGLARTSTIEYIDNPRISLQRIKIDSRSSLNIEPLKVEPASQNDSYLSQTEDSISLNDDSSSSLDQNAAPPK